MRLSLTVLFSCSFVLLCSSVYGDINCSSLISCPEGWTVGGPAITTYYDSDLEEEVEIEVCYCVDSTGTIYKIRLTYTETLPDTNEWFNDEEMRKAASTAVAEQAADEICVEPDCPIGDVYIVVRWSDCYEWVKHGPAYQMERCGDVTSCDDTWLVLCNRPPTCGKKEGYPELVDSE